MSSQPRRPQQVNRSHLGAIALMLLATGVVAHAAATTTSPARLASVAVGDRAEPRAAHAHGSGVLRPLTPDVLNFHPAAAVPSAPRPQPPESLRQPGAILRGPRVQTDARGADDSGARVNSALALRWQDRPEWERNIRSFRRGGAPLVRFWQSSHAAVGLGVSRHGIAGIYLTKTLAR